MPSSPAIGNEGRTEGRKLFPRLRLHLRRDSSKTKQLQLVVEPLNNTLTNRIGRKHHDSFPSSTVTIDARLKALVQSAEPFHVLKDLADSVVGLRSSINHSSIQDGQKIFRRSFDILEAVAEAVGDAMDSDPNPQISSGLSVQIEDLTRLFSNMQICIASQGSSSDLNMLRKQLDVSHSDLVRASGRLRRLRENSTVVCREVLQVVAQSSDTFPPLKSAVSGILAIWNIEKRVSAIEPKARDLLARIQSLDPGDGDTSQADEVSALFSAQKRKLEHISAHRPFFSRFKRLAHDEDALRHAQVVIDHFCQEAAVRGLRDTSKLVEAVERSRRQINSLQNAAVLDLQVTSKLVETVERSQRQINSLRVLVTLVLF
ncbi:hypothetical protein D9758_003071 [Tetrapyrgos nigripes]|uniref:Uncharacterized protein n=1 Tax=Tetrapyrgos nigripes TaxID=182062 RepID=A0A8H5GPU4_9AGAR|nr:hypothetical protein D9758_003071 [Tetrapyrgos nigripes]